MQTTTSSLEFDDLPVGSRVKVVSEEAGSRFWYGERGVVESNSGEHRGVKVRFDNPTILGSRIARFSYFGPENLELTIDETATLDELEVYLAGRMRRAARAEQSE